MPPPLGAGGIMFSGCQSARPSVRSLKYPLLTCTWVRWSTRPTVTVLRHVRPSVRPYIIDIDIGLQHIPIEYMITAGTLGCVFIDNETHSSGVTKCTTGEAWSAFS